MVVSDLAGGFAPAPDSLPAAPTLHDEPHPAGTASLGAHLRPASPQPSGLAQQEQFCDPQLHPHVASDSGEAMQVDRALLSRSQSPALSGGMGVAALRAPPPSDQQASGFVPLSEVGGSGASSHLHEAAVEQQHPAEQQPQSEHPHPHAHPSGRPPLDPHLPLPPRDTRMHEPHQPAQPSAHEQQSQPSGSSMGEPSSRPDRPPSGAGYESGDDMDMLAVQHCTNCTGTLWGHICMDCGHMPAHDVDIFQPTVASASALHRPRLQGDALTVIAWDERMELHEEAGASASMHPERPDRVRAVMARLQAAELAGRCRRLPAREATAEEIQACHIPELLARVDLLSEHSRLQGGNGLHYSPDTYVNQHTALCARLSAGACVDAATAVMRGEARAGVAVVRPPGHHAESNTAMGFCFFNNAGIAARAAQAAGAGRVLILDWDVHHGNGTQHIFEEDPSVLYMSLHRYDGGSFYPGTGAAHEVGEGPGAGYTVNVPWPCGGMRNGDYLAAFQHVVVPIAYEFAPDLVIISAGFDAAEGDPIGGCHLTPEIYAHMAAQLQLVAPTVALLEGGYNLLSTAKGTEAVVRVLLGERPPALPAAELSPSEYGMGAVAQVMRVQSRHWECMRQLVQQQFKVLAAAAARQEALAAMKLRREALGGGASSGEGLGDGECEEEEEEVEGDEDMSGGEEEAAEAHVHRRPPPGLDGDEAETDTPHQQYRGGSGWESDADLASDEEPLSEDEDSQEELEDGEAAAAAQPEEDVAVAAEPDGLLQQHQQHVLPHVGGPQLQQPLAEAGPGDASPQHGAAGWGASSDTLPISDSEAPCSGSDVEQHAQHAQQAQHAGQQAAGLTSSSLSPAPPAGGDVLTPPGEQLLAASATPASEATAAGAAAADGLPTAPTPASPVPDAAAAAAGGAWPGLAAKHPPLKRASHQRLSPPVVDDDAMALVRPCGSQQEQPHEAEQLVPQTDGVEHQP